MGTRRSDTPAPVKRISRWVRSRSVREMLGIGAAAAATLFILLWLFVKDHGFFFIPARASHAVGLLVLIYKLSISRTCAGLSLKSQELTAIYLVTRLMSSFYFIGHFHVLIDFVTLGATLWMIYMMRVKLKSSYMKELDNMPLYYVLVPCAIAALLAHPKGAYYSISTRFLWPFTIAVEAIAVLPQLRLIQNAKMVEPFTAHYVFALGVSRFFQFAFWIIQLIETKGLYLTLIGSGHWWILLALASEVVQTFILADFCYYYVKSVMAGQIMTRLPSLV